MSRAITRCPSCRCNILDAFTTLAGITIRSPLRASQSALLRSYNKPTIRPLSTSKTIRASELSDSTTVPKAGAAVPWYLQVETPTPPAPASPHLLLQEIPPIPEDAPPILEPILSHLSTSIGLDNLTLLDLRSMHPPPALGSNLLMILGTARSYKHLNTSADRFARWIRSKYKLSPYADGLLGRNELKLKLRRKARRLKLAQSVGNTTWMDNQGKDDGITTGWICVNLGDVSGARMPADAEDARVVEAGRAQDGEDQESLGPSRQEQEEPRDDEDEYVNPSTQQMSSDKPDGQSPNRFEATDEAPDDGYIGFGSRSAGPRIVVQIFTEEKRLEMDLEGLYDFRRERRERRKAAADAQFAAENNEQRQDTEDKHEHEEVSKNQEKRQGGFTPWAY